MSGPRTPRDLVQTFFDHIWNAGEFSVAKDILTDDLRFRGTLGAELEGVEPFLDYVREVRGALAGYICQIDDLVIEGDKAFARMRFSGRHHARFLGFEPTGLRLEWAGAVLFETKNGRIASVWALGDLAGLKALLEKNREAAT